MTELQVTWFLLVGVLLTVYAVLDGFDLGVGIFHLFTRGDEQRRTLLRAVGPVWDGNEVWLLTGGGALFAAFPPVYATVFSGLYLPVMVVLFALITRAVSFEFRSKEESPRWRRSWDVVFAAGSIVPALAFGVVVGNLLRGVPLDANTDVAGDVFGLLNPFSVLVGTLGFFVLAQQGATYAWMKTEGSLAEQARGWSLLACAAATLLFLVVTAFVLVAQPHLRANFTEVPLLWALPVLAFAGLALTGLAVLQDAAGRAFLCSSLSITMMMGLFGASMFPNFVRASNDPRLSLTAFDASSSELTLQTMLVLAGLGMPVVAAYTIWVYRKFRGKVRPDGY